MKHDCFNFIDKALRKGRAKYICKCGKDVSLMWYFYQLAINEL